MAPGQRPGAGFWRNEAARSLNEALSETGHRSTYTPPDTIGRLLWAL
jgi:hypothetical protein